MHLQELCPNHIGKLSIPNSPTALLHMHHFTCVISSLLHSVNLILFTLLLVHLILRSPHHSHHLRSHYLSLPRPFTPDLKLISFKNPFLHVTLIPSGLPSQIITWALASVCFNFFFFHFFHWLHVLD